MWRKPKSLNANNLFPLLNLICYSSFELLSLESRFQFSKKQIFVNKHFIPSRHFEFKKRADEKLTSLRTCRLHSIYPLSPTETIVLVVLQALVRGFPGGMALQASHTHRHVFSEALSDTFGFRSVKFSGETYIRQAEREKIIRKDFRGVDLGEWDLKEKQKWTGLWIECFSEEIWKFWKKNNFGKTFKEQGFMA